MVSPECISAIASGMEFAMRANFHRMTYDYYAYSPPWCGWRLDRPLAARSHMLATFRVHTLTLTHKLMHLLRRYTKRGIIATFFLAAFLASNVIYRVLSIAICVQALGASAGALVGGMLVVDHIIFQVVRRQDDAHMYDLIGLPSWLVNVWFWMAIQFFPMPWIRDPCFVGAQNYAIWLLLGLVESTCFLMVSVVVDDVEAMLLIVSGTCCMATIVSIVVGLATIDPKFRRFFWLRERVRENQTRDWSADHAQSEEDRDLVRSMLFSAYVEKSIPQYFDPVVVNDWLKEGWARWQATTPEWFTPTWMALANAHMDRVASKESPKAPSLPPAHTQLFGALSERNSFPDDMVV
jgi:hypothetical protein